MVRCRPVDLLLHRADDGDRHRPDPKGRLSTVGHRAAFRAFARAAKRARIRRDDPAATVIVHGEVRPDLQRAADAVLSTSQMAKYVEAHPDKSRYAILTECGLVVRLELEHPEKQFYKPCRLCQYMKATDLESVYRTLRDEPAEQRITVPADVREGAARAMLRMIELAA